MPNGILDVLFSVLLECQTFEVQPYQVGRPRSLDVVRPGVDFSTPLRFGRNDNTWDIRIYR